MPRYTITECIQDQTVSDIGAGAFDIQLGWIAWQLQLRNRSCKANRDILPSIAQKFFHCRLNVRGLDAVEGNPKLDF